MGGGGGGVAKGGQGRGGERFGGGGSEGGGVGVEGIGRVGTGDEARVRGCGREGKRMCSVVGGWDVEGVRKRPEGTWGCCQVSVSIFRER